MSKIRVILTLAVIATLALIGYGTLHLHLPLAVRVVSLGGSYYLVACLMGARYLTRRHQAGLVVQLAIAREQIAAHTQLEREFQAAMRAERRRGFGEFLTDRPEKVPPQARSDAQAG